MSKFNIGDTVVLVTDFDNRLHEAADIVKISHDGCCGIKFCTDGILDDYHESHLQLKSEYDMQNKKESKLIPFDLERAKRGDKVINGKGQDVRVICFDRISKDGNLPILALHKEIDQEFCRAHSIDGRFLNTEGADDLHLFMLPIKKSGWIAIVKYIETGVSSIGSITANTEEELIRQYDSSAYGIVSTKLIEWEE